MKRILIAASMLMLASSSIVSAADMVEPEVPEPPIEQKGIWGAIAYSEHDGEYGFFWGADKRDEAEEIAVKHCENADGKSCELVLTFRNHRHWDDDDDSGFPYKHCGALAIAKDSDAPKTIWGSQSAETRKDAEELSLKQCEAKGQECKIKEWVCT